MKFKLVVMMNDWGDDRETFDDFATLVNNIDNLMWREQHYIKEDIKQWHNRCQKSYKGEWSFVIIADNDNNGIFDVATLPLSIDENIIKYQDGEGKEILEREMQKLSDDKDYLSFCKAD